MAVAVARIEKPTATMSLGIRRRKCAVRPALVRAVGLQHATSAALKARARAGLTRLAACSAQRAFEGAAHACRVRRRRHGCEAVRRRHRRHARRARCGRATCSTRHSTRGRQRVADNVRQTTRGRQLAADNAQQTTHQQREPPPALHHGRTHAGGHTEALAVLADCGANLSAKDEIGRTTVMCAAQGMGLPCAAPPPQRSCAPCTETSDAPSTITAHPRCSPPGPGRPARVAARTVFSLGRAAVDRAQSRCRCGGGEPSSRRNCAGGEPWWRGAGGHLEALRLLAARGAPLHSATIKVTAPPAANRHTLPRRSRRRRVAHARARHSIRPAPCACPPERVRSHCCGAVRCCTRLGGGRFGFRARGE